MYIFSYTCGEGFFESTDLLLCLILEDFDLRRGLLDLDSLEATPSRAQETCLDLDREVETSKRLECCLLRDMNASFAWLVDLGLDSCGS